MLHKFLLKFVLMLVLASSFPSNAQCAMCRATVESASKNGENRAAGMNTGILYLMSIPYIIGGVIAYLWFKNSKKEQQERLRIQQRLRSLNN
ncbi:MAG: hypothetical protein SNJ77_11580 [Cytophagales bacterium]